ncbi:MAG TPA: 7TM-DISM domain-containing protein, partial [Flavobacteriales bacterium]|nr:7TM-DISM domain-containing protein [Flavobacteriales bacterium]
MKTRSRRTILTISGALIVGLSVIAQPVPVAQGPHHLGKEISILEDASAKLDVTQVEKSTGFERSTMDVPNLGVTTSAYWVRFDVLNDTKEDAVILDLQHAEIEEVDVYLLQSGSIVQLAHTGQNAPLTSRAIAQPEFVLSLPIGRAETARVLLRLKSDKQLQVPLQLHEPSRFSESRSMKNLVIGIYIGIMLVMAFYNLFVYFSIRDRSYLIYV